MLYQGNTRTNTIDVLVDAEKIVSWTSSGATTAFETVELGATGQTMELEGVLTDPECLSIMEVRDLHVCSGPRPNVVFRYRFRSLLVGNVVPIYCSQQFGGHLARRFLIHSRT